MFWGSVSEENFWNPAKRACFYTAGLFSAFTHKCEPQISKSM